MRIDTKKYEWWIHFNSPIKIYKTDAPNKTFYKRSHGIYYCFRGYMFGLILPIFIKKYKINQ